MVVEVGDNRLRVLHCEDAQQRDVVRHGRVRDGEDANVAVCLGGDHFMLLNHIQIVTVFK